MTIRIVLVDDQPLMRAGLRLIIDAVPDLEVVAEGDDGDQAVALVDAHDPDLVLMDIRMTRVDGIEATRRVVARGSRARVLMLTTYDLDEHLYQSVRAGAIGFLLKTAPVDQLVGTIRAAAAGDTVLAPSITRRLLDEFAAARTPGASRGGRVDRIATLTEREREVLVEVARGLSNDEIADLLVVSPTTVKSHVNSLFRKLEVRDRVQAVILAFEAGLVRPGTE